MCSSHTSIQYREKLVLKFTLLKFSLVVQPSSTELEIEDRTGWGMRQGVTGNRQTELSVLQTQSKCWTGWFSTDSHTPAPKPHLTLGFHGSAFCTTEGVAGLGGVGGISSSLPAFKPSISRIRSSSRSRPPSKGSSRLLCLTKLFTL